MNFIKSRSFLYSTVAVVLCIAIVAVIINITNNKPDFELNPHQNIETQSQEPAFSYTEITVNQVVVGKKHTETASGKSTLIAEANSGYTFAYWTRTQNNITSKISGKETIVVESSAASSITPVFVDNSRVLQVSSLADITSNYNNASYDILVLTQDIDATGINYTPVGTFAKVLDGAGYTIHNLSAECSNQANWGGITQNLTGVIKNISLDACLITDTTSPAAVNMGGFAGTISTGLISNCVMKSTVQSSNTTCNVGAFVGAATGEMDTSFIEGCSNEGAVMGQGVGVMICSNPNAACTLVGNTSIGSITPTN